MWITSQACIRVHGISGNHMNAIHHAQIWSQNCCCLLNSIIHVVNCGLVYKATSNSPFLIADLSQSYVAVNNKINIIAGFLDIVNTIVIII